MINVYLQSKIYFLGGTLIQHLKEHILFGNMKESDIIFYYTTVRIKKNLYFYYSAY